MHWLGVQCYFLLLGWVFIDQLWVPLIAIERGVVGHNTTGQKALSCIVSSFAMASAVNWQLDNSATSFFQIGWLNWFNWVTVSLSLHVYPVVSLYMLSAESKWHFCCFYFKRTCGRWSHCSCAYPKRFLAWTKSSQDKTIFEADPYTRLLYSILDLWMNRYIVPPCKSCVKDYSQELKALHSFQVLAI